VLDHYQPVDGPIPVRARWDHDPLHHKEDLLRATRRV
jgi:ribosomal protection tetracycline resistance protein